MEKVYDGLWVGADEDSANAKSRGYARLAVCKEGPDGHRQMCDYSTPGATHNGEYLFAKRGTWAAMNCIDVEHPEMIPTAMIIQGLKFIHAQLKAGRKILVHCNAGRSRGPSMVLMYLHAIGELPQGIERAHKIFKTIYPKFDPQRGMRMKMKELWDQLPKILGNTSR